MREKAVALWKSDLSAKGSSVVNKRAESWGPKLLHGDDSASKHVSERAGENTDFR